MKNLSLTLFFFILFSSTIQSQANLEWESRFNGPTASDKGNKVVVDDDGNVYVTGKSDGTSDSDYLTIKYNAHGDTLWTARYNGIADGADEALGIIVDRNGNVYVTGKSKGSNSGLDITTIKYNSAGGEQWVRIFTSNSNTDDIPYDLVLDAFNNLYVCGGTGSNGVVLKYNPNGNSLWIVYPIGTFQCNKILINHLGNIIVSSYGLANLSVYPFFINELDASTGSRIYTYNNALVNQVPGSLASIVLDKVGNIYTMSSYTGASSDRIYTAKFARGIEQSVWSFYQSTGSSSVTSKPVQMSIDKEDNLYQLTEIHTNVYYYYLKKLNKNGTQDWVNAFISSNGYDEYPIAMSLSNLNSPPDIYLAGYNSLGNIRTFKYSNAGDSLWTKIYDCGNNGADLAASMVIDQCDNIFITGSSACNNTSQDIKTIKYSTAILPIITVIGPNPICEGTSIMLSTTTCIGCTYLWSSGETNSSITVSPIIETDYSVSVKYPSECELTSLPKKIMVNPLLTPGVSLTAASPSICKGENVIFTANPINGGVNPSFQWYLNSVLQNGNTSTFSISTLNDGAVVSSTMTSNANCLATNIANSNSVTMSVFELLPTGITISSSNNTICQGESVTFLATPLNGGASPVYQWFIDGVLQSNQSGSSFTSPLNQSATIYGTMTSNAVCPDPSIVSSESIFITVKPNLTPQISISASSNEICEGVNVIFTASQMNGGTNPVYKWFVNGVLQPINNAIFSDNNFTNGANISSTMTTSELCTTQANATSNIISLTVNPKVIPTIEIVSDLTSFCAGKSVTISSSITNGGNAPIYKWYIDNVLQSQDGNTFSTSDLLNGAEVFGILTSNAICLDQSNAMSNAISFTVHSLPEALIIPDGPTTFCQGNSVQLSANDAELYLWSSDSATTKSIIVSSSGNFTVTITDVNGCTAFSNAEVTVNPLPSNKITSSGFTTFCEGKSVTLTADSTLNYKWSTDETSQSINVSSEGDYVVTVTNENGCSAISLPTTITVNPLPVAMILPDGPTTFCLGENVILTASEAQSYVWSSGQTSRSVDITSPGVNVVTVTDANGCSAISSDMLVTVNPLIAPAVTILSSANAICAGDNVTFTSTATNSGPMPVYQWYVNGNLQTENGPVFSTTTLTNNEQVLCRMTSNAECLTQPLVQSNIISIAVNPLLKPEVTISTISNSVLACQEVTFTPTPTNGGISPTYQWFLNGNPVSSTPTFSTSAVINGDQISCIMTSSATCKSSATAQSNIIPMSVSQLAQPTITISEDTISSVNYKDARYGYIWYYNGSVVAASPSIICSQYGNGSYYLVINYNGCTVTSNVKDIVCTVPTKDLDKKSSFIVYPNPTNSIINFSGINISSGEFRLGAYNMLGQKLEEKRILSLNNSLDSYLDMSDYTSGIYTIVVYGETYRQVFKVHKIE